MSLQDVISEINKKTASFDESSYDGFLALQITLKDLNEVFYIEIKDRKLSIEPYEYHDRQADLIISSGNLIKLINRKLDPTIAFTTGKLKIQGDIGKASELMNLFRS